MSMPIPLADVTMVNTKELLERNRILWTCYKSLKDADNIDYAPHNASEKHPGDPQTMVEKRVGGSAFSTKLVKADLPRCGYVLLSIVQVLSLR